MVKMTTQEILQSIKDWAAPKVIYDISAAHNNTKYTDLADALGTNGENIPQEYKGEGGITVRFVRTSDNKYLQYRLMNQNWSTTVSDWAEYIASYNILYSGYIHLLLDKKDRILVGIRNNGDIYYGYGVPSQIVDYINSKISDLHTEEIFNFIGNLIDDDKTLQELLEEKVDKIEGKELIDSDYSSGVSYDEVSGYLALYIDNNHRLIKAIKKNGDEYWAFGIPSQIQEVINTKVDKETGKSLADINLLEHFSTQLSGTFMSLELDGKSKILGGRRSNGNKFENAPVETPSAIFKSFNDPGNRFNIILDGKNRIMSFRDSNGVLHENAGIKTPIAFLESLYIENRNILEYLNDISSLVNSFRDNFEIDNKLRMFDSMICIGDSVTDGHIFWRQKGNVVSRKYSYPSQLNKMFPEMSITNAGFAGITIDGWNTGKFSDYDFMDYGVAVIELGYNGGTKPISDTFDTDVAPYGDDYMNYADTGMGNYCQLIKKIQNANPYIFVILVCSRAQSDSRKQGIFRVAKEFDLPLIDLSDTTLYPINFEDGNMPFSNAPAVHASPWGYLLKASYIRRGIGKAIDEYYERAVTCVFGQNDWIWKITCEMSDSTKGTVNTPYVEVIACYTGIIGCEVNEGETFEGWYYNNNGTEVLLSSEKTFTFDPYSYQGLFRYQTPRAITVIAMVS